MHAKLVKIRSPTSESVTATKKAQTKAEEIVKTK
jgi:hypothetical protein